MFKKEINNAPLTHLGGKGGYYRKLLIVFILIFALIVPFSVSAQLTTNSNGDISFASSDITPIHQMLSYGENIYGLDETFVEGSSNYQGNSFSMWRGSSGNYSLSSSIRDFSFVFKPKTFSIYDNCNYEVYFPVVIRFVSLSNVKLSDYSININGSYETVTMSNYRVSSATTDGMTDVFFDLKLNIQLSNPISALGISFSVSASQGSLRWTGFYKDITFKRLDPTADKIVGAIENQKEQEKNEINSSGNSNLDGLTSAVPDYSSGFVTALTKLGSSMGYNGRDSVWTIPPIYIPEIQGVIPKTKIIDSQSINFSDMFNKIPSNIIVFIRSLTSILLIVYCGKELYGLFSFVFNSGKGINL